MRRGAKQPVIAEYCHSRLTAEQQQFLTESLVHLNTTSHKGYVLGKGEEEASRAAVQTPVMPGPDDTPVCGQWW